MMSRMYLVTGGAGFLGSALVRRLVDAGHQVRILDDLSRGALDRVGDLRTRVECIAGDIRDADTVARAVEGVDVVCHLAFINGTEFFYTQPDLVLDVGVKGIVNVIDACRQHGVQDLLLMSSSEVYQNPPTLPAREDVPLQIPDPLNPRYSYAGGKIISELLAINYGRGIHGRVLIARPHNVYGPSMGWEHVIPQFILRMRELSQAQPTGAIPFPIQGTGEETRAFVYIDDFTDGVLRVLAQGAHLGIYHIGTQAEVSIADLARLVGRCVEREVQLVPQELTAGSVLRRCPDIGKMAALGYAPQVTLEAGLRKTMRWYDAHAAEQPRRPDASTKVSI
jgi:nucleoside-diphosphate-sugar epimerase